MNRFATQAARLRASAVTSRRRAHPASIRRPAPAEALERRVLLAASPVVSGSADVFEGSD